MAIREIVIYPDDRLRKPTKEVTVFDDELKELVQDMFDSMYHYDGIGLAAPQIGVSKRVVTIDICDYDNEGNAIEHHPLVLINPKILEKSGTTEYKEGCLSVPEYYDVVTRAEKVKVEAQDVEGNTHIYEADDLLAICMQHEIDHLEGHLFVDYLSSLKRDRVTKKMLQLKKEQKNNS
ncbi:peptide deformylase [Anaerobiospirillum sp. NML120448]|uniref:peptide deformylase n=1 Tax=Anaerobiospirillum sp. NML120448 TaxID=2932816 RepID=UPI001FF16FE1|nr:peptide deformylase [Anaerobiospirillum sp. NML120448]MCK0514695.1 peptide deformylase [Anaerobiospirillum sp. NML120448]